MNPYAIYLDFESTLTKTNEKKGEKSELVNEHVANSYCFIVIGPDGKEVKEFKRFYRGEDAAIHCLKDLREVSLLIKPLLNQYPDHNLTDEEEAEYQKVSKCYMCNDGFLTDDKYIGRELEDLTDDEKKEFKYLTNHKKVRDPCYHSGVYRGAAHNNCNLKCKVKRNVDVFIHNGKNYDNHLLMSELHNLSGDKFDVIATNSEKYISFSIYHKSDDDMEDDKLRAEKRKEKTSLKGKIQRRENKAAEEAEDLSLGALSLECEDDEEDELDEFNSSLDDIGSRLGRLREIRKVNVDYI